VDPKKQKALRTRFMVYGGLVAALWGFYIWQPYEFDLVARKPPGPNPPVDPDSKFLFSERAKVLIVTAHPDDSSFFVGGLLTRLADAGTEIHQVIATDGDKGYYPFEDWQKNRRERRIEALDEANAWGGKDILFLGQPDGRLRSDRIVESIEGAIKRVQPDYLICFDGEYPDRMSHNDHRRSGEAAWQAALATGIPKWVLMFQTNAPNFVVDITDQWEAQKDLLKIHKSQFFGEHLQGIYNMVEGRALKDGERVGLTYGEGLRCVRLGK
jgi:LmbE family N-acetylglucosaminyl deacetylase